MSSGLERAIHLEAQPSPKGFLELSGGAREVDKRGKDTIDRSEEQDTLSQGGSERKLTNTS